MCFLAFSVVLGPIKEAKCIEGRGVGFVTFEGVDATYAAIKESGTRDLDGSSCECKIADAPKSYGGSGGSSYGTGTFTHILVYLNGLI